MGFLGLFLRLFWGAFFVNILLVENSALANPCVLEHARRALAKFNEDKSEVTQNPRGQLRDLRNLTHEQLRQLPEGELKAYLSELIKMDPIRGGYTIGVLKIEDVDLRSNALFGILKRVHSSDPTEPIDPKAIAALRALKVENVPQYFRLGWIEGDGRSFGKMVAAFTLADLSPDLTKRFVANAYELSEDLGKTFLYDFENGLSQLKAHPTKSALVNEMRAIGLKKILGRKPYIENPVLVEQYLMKVAPNDKDSWIKVLQNLDFRLNENLWDTFFSRFRPTQEDFVAIYSKRDSINESDLNKFQSWFTKLDYKAKKLIAERLDFPSWSNSEKFFSNLDRIGITKTDQVDFLVKQLTKSNFQRGLDNYSNNIEQMKASGLWKPSHTQELAEAFAKIENITPASLKIIKPLWAELANLPPETQINIYRQAIFDSQGNPIDYLGELAKATAQPELLKEGIIREIKRRFLVTGYLPSEANLANYKSQIGLKFPNLEPLGKALKNNKNQAVFEVLKQALLKSTSDPELLKALGLATHFERADVTRTLAQDTINYYLTFEKYPETLADLVSFSYGIPKEKLTARALDRNTVSDLLDSLGGTRQFLGDKEFEQLKIPIVKLESGTSAKVLVDISDSLRALLTLESTPQTKAKLWQEILKSEGLHESKTFTEAELKALSQRLDTKVAQAAQKVFKTPELNFNKENLEALQKKWGDINSIYRLLGRFKENPSWNSEIPALGRYLKAVLDGKFVEHKFDGLGGEEAKAAKQLAILKTPEAQKAWREERSGVRIAADDKFFDQKKATDEAIKNNIENMFVVHAGEALGSKKPNVPYEKTAGALKNILTGPDDFMTAWSTWKNSAENAVYKDEASLRLVHAATDILKSQEVSLDQKIQVINKLSALGNKNEIELPEQLKDDIKSIVTAQRSSQSQNKGTRISVTLITADPKAMILVGDLVNTGSCQKISGCHAETLLGYVKDANVKIILSKSLIESDFKTPAEWNRVLSFMANGGALQARWNPLDSSLTLSDAKAGGEKSFEVRTKPFEFFDRRHVLKLGEAVGRTKPGLVRERPYNQPTEQQRALESQALEMTTRLASDLAGVYGQPMTIVGSRNPLGVYSDAAGGVKNGEYEIKQPDFK
jgi:hypothetical protein